MDEKIYYTDFGDKIIFPVEEVWELLPDKIVDGTFRGELLCGICLDKSPCLDYVTGCCKRVLHVACLTTLSKCTGSRKCPYCRKNNLRPDHGRENWG